MTREEAKNVLYEWQEMMVRNGVPIDTSKVQALRVAIEVLSKPIVDITQRELCEDISCTDCPFMQETCKLMDYVAYAEAVQGWIPCSERLPRENGVYIVSLEDAVYPWATFHNGGWFMLSVDNTAREFGAYEVIAWMPLPKPYKGGGSE